MGMNTTKAPQAGSAAQAIGGKVGDPDSCRSSDNDVPDVSPAVDEEGQLAVAVL